MKRIGNIFKAKSLKWQLLFRSFLVLILLLFIMGTSQYIIMRQYLYHTKEQALESRLHNVSKGTMEELESPQAIMKNAPYLVNKIKDHNVSVVIIDRNGKIIAEGIELNRVYTAPHLSQDDYKKILQQKRDLKGYQIIKDNNDNANIVIWRSIGKPYSSYGLIQISTSIQLVENMLRGQLLIYIAAAVLILIIGVLVGGIVLKNTLKPLYNMTNTLEQITVGQLNIRLPVDNGQLEIDSLSKAFNDMFKRIEISFEKEQCIKEKMRRFISNASHELRTPLTSIHGFVEVLLRGAAKNEKQLDLALNSILIESERLTKLVNDLLLLTKLDQQIEVEMLVENIKDIIEEIYPQLQIISGERQIQLQLEDNILVKANRNQIKQVIFNLVQNAIQHTDDKSGVITISINSIDKPSGKFAIIKVNDNGTGIPKEDLNEIFDRFFRSESHRSRKYGGYGLGLAIVKSIVNTHHGEIHVDSELNKGTAFSIYLKLIKVHERDS